MANEPPAINKIRLPEEHVIAVMAGSSYKPSKIKMRALDNLIGVFKNGLVECDRVLNEYYANGGVVRQEVDGYFSFSHEGSKFEVCVSDSNIDYESFVEVLDAIRAYKKRIALITAIRKTESAIDMVDKDMSLAGTSEFAQSIRSDPRFMSTLMDGCELEDEIEENEDEEEVEE